MITDIPPPEMSWEEGLEKAIKECTEFYTPHTDPEWEDRPVQFILDGLQGSIENAIDLFKATGDPWPCKFWFGSLFRFSWLAIYELFRDDPRDETVSLEIIEDLKILLIKKHKDYGNKPLADSGIDGIFIRINDKVNRIVNLFGAKRIAANEAAEDSFMDIMGYSVLGLMIIEKTFDLPISKNR